MNNLLSILRPFKNEQGQICYSMPWVLGVPAWLLLIGFGLTFFLMSSQF